MNKFRVRRQKYDMVKVKFGEIHLIEAVLLQWWNIKGLPWPFLQQVDNVITAIAAGKETFEKMKHKMIDDYAEKDEAGEIVRVTDEDGRETGIPSFGENQAEVDALWNELTATTFDCPSLAASTLKDCAETLGLTLATLRMIKPIVAE